MVHAVPADGPRRRGRRSPACVTPGGASRSRPSAADLERAVATGAVVPDVVAPGLDVLFCGINPGRWSGALGHHFAHPGNRFWKALHLAGYTDRLLTPAEDRLLLDANLGITNLVVRTTAKAAELSPGELRRGAEALVRKVERLQPGAVAFLGLGAYRTAFGVRASPGRQATGIANAIVWVLPNPSGLQAHYSLQDLVAELVALRGAARSRWHPG